MTLSGQAAYNGELQDHGVAPVGLLAYLATGDLLSALFENWESKFLQMATYVMLTAMLFQRGSSEPAIPMTPAVRIMSFPSSTASASGAHMAYSLGIVLATLFVISFFSTRVQVFRLRMKKRCVMAASFSCLRTI